MSDPRPRPSVRVSFGALVVTAAAACQSGRLGGGRDVASAIQHERYDVAVAEARRQAEANPGDPGAQALLEQAQVAWLLDRGRVEIFRGNLARGLDYLEQAEELAPEHPSVESWIRKARAQLANEWLDAAAENTGPEKLDEAEHCYEMVLHYDPRNRNAIDGLAQLLLLKNYRAGMSKTYFDDGVSSFRELLLQQARRSFQVSRLYRENEPATLRGQQVEKLIAEERLAQAQRLEESGLYFAARNEYRLVLLIEPDSAAGREGLDRMDRETRAKRTLSEADMAIRRGALDHAAEALAEVGPLTEMQRDDVSLLQAGIEERRLEDRYLEARTLSDDYRYPEAVAAFDELLAMAPDYKDAALRKSTLEEFIRLAEEFYAKALEAEDDAVAEEYLRAIHPIIWPEYKDVVERLKAIEARKAERERAGGVAEDGGG
jgi:tetratricopeptide (TPR) repeat protein